MGETLTRNRSNAVSEGSRKQSLKVDNLLSVLGRAVSSGISAGKGRPVLDKQNVTEQRQKFGERVKAAAEAIDADLKVLEMFPGTEDLVAKWRRAQEDAGRLQAIGYWGDSLRELEKVHKELHEAVISQKTTLTQKLEQSGKERKKYEQLNGEILALASDLQAFPDGPAWVQNGVDLRVATARSLFDKSDFAGAVRELEGAKQDCKAKLKEWDKQKGDCSGVMSPFKDIYAKYKELAPKLETAEEVLGKDGAKPFAELRTGLYRDMLAATTGKKPKDAVKGLASRVSALERDLNQAIQTAQSERTSALDKAGELQRAIATKGEFAPAEQVKQAYAALNAIRTAIAEHKHADALDQCRSLEETLKQWGEVPSGGKALAEKIRKDFLEPAKTELARAQEHVKQAKTITALATPPTADSALQMLQRQIDMCEGSPNTFPLSEGLGTLHTAKKINDENDARAEQFEELAEVREKHGATINGLADGVIQALEAMKKKLAEQGTAVKELPSYGNRLQSALDGWKDASGRATTEDELRFPEFSGLLEALRKEIEEDAANPVRLGAKAVEGQFADLSNSFREAEKAAQEAVDALMEVDYGGGDAEGKQLDSASARFRDALKAQDAAAAQKAIDAVVACGERAKEAERKANSAVALSKLNLEVQLKDVADKILGLEGAIDNSKLKDYAKLVAALRAEWTQLNATHASQDATIIDETLTSTYALRDKVRDLQALFGKITKGDKLGKDDLTLDKLKKRSKEILDSFSDKKVESLEADALEALKKKHGQVDGAIGTIPLAESKTQLEALVGEWEKLKQKAAQHERDVETFKGEIDTALDQVGKSLTFAKYPDYKKALTARLQALRKEAKDSGTLDREKLDAIKKEVTDSEQTGGVAERNNALAQTSELAEQTAEKRWTADWTAFQGRLQGLRAIGKGLDGPAAKGFAEQLKQLEDTASVVKKREGKAPYQTMCEQLESLFDTADTMRDYPMGRATHARGQVLDADKHWNGAVAEFHTKLDQLHGAVGDSMKGDGNAQAVLGALQTKLDEAKELIKSGTITAFARKVVAAGDISAARDAREEALRELKRLQRAIEGAPALIPLMSNPFQVELGKALGNLSAALFSVETTLAISL